MLKVIIFILLTLSAKSYAFEFNFRMEKCLDLSLEKEFNFTLDDYVYNYLEFDYLTKEISVNWMYNPETYKNYTGRADESGSIYFDIFLYEDDLIKGVNLEDEEIQETIMVFPKEKRFVRTLTFVDVEKTFYVESKCLEYSS